MKIITIDLTSKYFYKRYAIVNLLRNKITKKINSSKSGQNIHILIMNSDTLHSNTHKNNNNL